MLQQVLTVTSPTAVPGPVAEADGEIRVIGTKSSLTNLNTSQVQVVRLVELSLFIAPER